MRPALSDEALRALLEELEQRLAESGISIALRPARHAGEVAAALEHAGLPARPELVVWWSWHDGADGEVVQSWRLLALHDALELRRVYAADYAAAGAADRWPDAWVPILRFDGRPLLCADAAVGTVHVEDDGFPEPAPPQFGSLADLAETLLLVVDGGLTPATPGLDPRARRLWWW